MTNGPVLRYDSDGNWEEVPPRPRTTAELLKEAALAIPNLVVLLGRLLKDPAVPKRRKTVAAAALAYFVSPIDVLPDFIPFVGRVDDVVILAAAIHHLMAAVPEDHLGSYWEGSQDALDIVAGIIEWSADLLPRAVRNLFGM